VRQDSHAYEGLLTVVPTDMLWQESDGQMINVSLCAVKPLASFISPVPSQTI
jgi:hypothetical protein